MTMWELIACILYQSTGLTNTEIAENPAVNRHYGERIPQTLAGVISKNLNAHSVEGTSNDKQRRPPFIFEKNDRRWFLTSEGKTLAKSMCERLG